MINQRQYFVNISSEAFDADFLRHEELFFKGDYAGSLQALLICKSSSCSNARLNKIRTLRKAARSENRTTLKIGWIDLYEHWNPAKNYITELLDLAEVSYEVVDDPRDANLLFAGVYGNAIISSGIWQNKFTILISGENVRPTYGIYDFSISTDSYDYAGKNIRHPEYFSQLELHADKEWRPKEDLEALKSYYRQWEDRDIFFSIIYNNSCPHREHFYQVLTRRYGLGSVQSYGSTRIGRDCNKYEILGRSKFHLAFENSVYPGYVTEKLFQSLMMGTFALYWGAADVLLDFGTKGYINIADKEFSNVDALFDLIDDINESPETRERLSLGGPGVDFIRSERLDATNQTDFLAKVCSAVSGIINFGG
jgi:hypothetical protein